MSTESFRIFFHPCPLVLSIGSSSSYAIKLEGGSPSRITATKAIVEAGIVGLTPQLISTLGGFRAQNVDFGLQWLLQSKFPQLASELVFFAVDKLISYCALTLNNIVHKVR
ncbi:hypothetical protein V6N13_079208 [Hibiscus sabdariffa]|uniref:Uncharacterized protein n=1 Tax=Hibiscus sabdariffa TaxID=183260 RepID=A0ABR2RR19_9ROSI